MMSADQRARDALRELARVRILQSEFHHILAALVHTQLTSSTHRAQRVLRLGSQIIREKNAYLLTQKPLARLRRLCLRVESAA